MLNDHEQRQLDAIEQALLLDTRLSACFRGKWPASPRLAFRPRWLIFSGALIMMASIVLELEGPFAQGLGLVVVGLTWSTVTSRVRLRRAKQILWFLFDPGEPPRRATRGPQS